MKKLKCSRKDPLLPASLTLDWSRLQFGVSRPLPRKPTLPCSPYFWQQLRQQEASGVDLEEKEEADNTEGEPWARLPPSPPPRALTAAAGKARLCRAGQDPICSGCHADHWPGSTAAAGAGWPGWRGPGVQPARPFPGLSHGTVFRGVLERSQGPGGRSVREVPLFQLPVLWHLEP